MAAVEMETYRESESLLRGVGEGQRERHRLEGCEGGDSPRRAPLAILSGAFRSPLPEIAGSLGDFGTLLPAIVALSQVGVLHAAAVFFFSGVWNVVTGIAFDVPVAVQPMHTIFIVATTESLTGPQITAAGIWMGSIIGVLGASGLIGRIVALVPLPCVRGLQLGLGLKLVVKGAHLILNTDSWTNSLDCILTGLLIFLVFIFLYNARHVPMALFVVVAGMIYAATQGTGMHVSPTMPPTWLGFPSASDWWHGFYRGALPQLPLTALNSIVALERLATDLYPGRPVSSRKASISIGMMNLASCFFGHFPSCHGSGGLAAQHRFGARTGSSMVFIGVFKMVFAIVFGTTLAGIFAAFPKSVLGAMLAISGIELALCTTDAAKEREDFLVALVGAGAVLSMNTGAAFVLMLVVAARFRAAPWIRELPFLRRQSGF